MSGVRCLLLQNRVLSPSQPSRALFATMIVRMRFFTLFSPQSLEIWWMCMDKTARDWGPGFVRSHAKIYHQNAIHLQVFGDEKGVLIDPSNLFRDPEKP